MSIRVLTTILTALSLCCAVSRATYAAGDITLSADASFVQMQARSVYPIAIQIANRGPSAQGVIHVHATSFGQPAHDYAYPIDLPSGTSKTLTAYPVAAQYTQSIDVSFDGPGRVPNVSLPIESTGNYGDQPALQVGLIGDQTGAFGALRSTGVGSAAVPPKGVSSASVGGSAGTASSGITFNDCYCSPEAAPDRAAGYDSMSVLAIGEGAERLTEDQWAAVRQWVVGGGSLLLLGGAGSLPHLTSRIAAEICPLDGPHEATFDSIALPNTKVSATYTAVAAIVGAPKPGAATELASGSHPLLTQMRYGAGLVTLVSFNPFAQPFQGTKQQFLVEQAAVMNSRGGLPSSELQGWAQSRTQSRFDHYTKVVRHSGHGVTTVTTTTTLPSSPSSATSDPFQIKLPPITLIGCTLLAYFILAVPVTYFVLRRMGKLEWAWVTTPILSAVFAVAFYLFTAKLYEAAMSRRTTGVVSLAAGTSDARFTGYTEIFFPHGGSYALQIPGAETLETGPEGDDEGFSRIGIAGFGSSSNAELDTFDTMDGVVAPDYSVPNLAFRRLYHSETVPLQGTIDGLLAPSGGSGVTGQITNSTNLSLTNVYLVRRDASAWMPLPNIAPGQSVTVPSQPSTSSVTGPDSEPVALINAQLRQAISPNEPGTALLVANVPAAQFGPQLGNDASGPDRVALLVSVPIRSEKASR